MKRFVLFIIVIVTIAMVHIYLQEALFRVLISWKEYADMAIEIIR